jgi:adenylosuccinate synthase
MGNGLVIDPGALLTEIESLEAVGVKVQGSLFISNRAHVLLPAHRMMEKMSEARPGRVSLGTTSRGIGPCYEDKIARRGIRVADLLDRDTFRARYDPLMEEKAAIARSLDISEDLDFGKIRQEYEAFAERIRPMVCDTATLLNGAIRDGKSVMFEGAQGTMLDIDHGTYHPYSSGHRYFESVHYACGRGSIPDRSLGRRGRAPEATRQRVRIGDGPATPLRLV